MIIELFRLDNNERIAISRHHLDNQWGWILENMREEFPHWWTQDVDTIDTREGTFITIGGEAKAVLKYRAGWAALRDEQTTQVVEW